MASQPAQNDRKRTIDQFQADYNNANASPTAQPSPFSPPAHSPHPQPTPGARSPTEALDVKPSQGRIPSFTNLQQPYGGSRQDVMQQPLPYSPQPSPQFQQPHPPPQFQQPQTPQNQQQHQAQQQGQSGQGSQAEQSEDKRPLDVKDLSDLVVASGIDIAEEEKFLSNYGDPQQQFSSWTSSQSTRPFSPQTSFDLLSQNNIHGQGAERASFQSDLEERRNHEHRITARKLAESKAIHLYDPFLLGASLARKIEKYTADNGVSVDLRGLFHAESGTHPDAPSILERPVKEQYPLQDILTTLSLAANERIRGLLEDAYGIARARQTYSDGIVPPDWADIARDEGTSKTTAVLNGISGTSWDQPPDSAISPMTKHNLPSPPVSVNSNIPLAEQKLPTIQHLPSKNPIAVALTKISSQERTAEEARLKKRADRLARRTATSVSAVQAIQDDGSGTSTGVATPAPTTPSAGIQTGILGEKAPEAKLTKKQRESQSKVGITEEMATRNANMTAAMQMGGKRYSWMTSGSKSTPQRPGAASRPSNIGAGTPTAGGTPSGAATPGTAADANKANADAARSQERKFGDWREDGKEGRGVQLRDWASVLEGDGRDYKTLSFALARLGKGDDNPASRT